MGTSSLLIVTKVSATERISFVRTQNTKLIAFHSPPPASQCWLCPFILRLTLSRSFLAHPESFFHSVDTASSFSHRWSCSLSLAMIFDTHLASGGIRSYKMPSSLGYTDSLFWLHKDAFFFFFFSPPNTSRLYKYGWQYSAEIQY